MSSAPSRSPRCSSRPGVRRRRRALAGQRRSPRGAGHAPRRRRPEGAAAALPAAARGARERPGARSSRCGDRRAVPAARATSSTTCTTSRTSWVSRVGAEDLRRHHPHRCAEQHARGAGAHRRRHGQAGPRPGADQVRRRHARPRRPLRRRQLLRAEVQGARHRQRSRLGADGRRRARVSVQGLDVAAQARPRRQGRRDADARRHHDDLLRDARPHPGHRCRRSST